MPRIARVVVPGYPHHVTQRGNRRQQVFFSDEDYKAYIELAAQWFSVYDVDVWAYCLMPNHVHLIVVPETEEGLRLAVGKAHLRYSRRINFREGWRGHLWQGRFASFTMDENYLLAAARYIEMNPVRAGLAKLPGDYPWSSAAAHLNRQDDDLVKAAPLLNIVPDWKAFLEQPVRGEDIDILRMRERTGRPAGDKNFLIKLETIIGRTLLPKKAGRKPRKKGEK